MAKKVVTVKGIQYKSLSDAARCFCLNPKLVQGRMERGWSLGQALQLEEPPKNTPARRVPVTIKKAGGIEEYLTIKDAALAHDLDPKVVRSRITTHGWTIEQALELYPREMKKAHNRKHVFFTLDDKKYEYASISEAAKAHGLNEFLVFGRLNGRGWDIKQALELAPPPSHTKKCYGYLYLITNSINGKKYVGQTMRAVDVRWEGHVKSAHQKKELNEQSLAFAILKYGPENFCIEKIDDAHSHDELNKLERYWIKTHKTLYPDGYNLSRGGGGITRGQPIKIKGKSYASITDAAREFNLKSRLVLDRLRYGWDIAQAFEITPPPDSQKYAGRDIEIRHNNEVQIFSSIGELARHFNLPVATVLQRIVKLKWTPEQAVELVSPDKCVHPMHNFKLEINGEVLEFSSKSEAASHFGFKRWSTVQKRIDRGWGVAQALGLDNPPINKFVKKEVTVLINGDEVTYKSQMEAAKSHSISFKKVSARRKLGWSYEEALEIVPRNSSKS